ncbi:MAG: hypothetical protein ACTSUR_08905 [Candidatus Heimdallarchaeaceae archaeon]
MKNETNFCLRVDIDTYEGLIKGLPKIEEFAKKQEIPLTVYLSLGKYATGRNIFRIIKKREFFKNRIQPWKRNHLKSLLRGIILPAKKLGKKEKELLRKLEGEEHLEFHPHGYNHVKWSSSFEHFKLKKTEKYMKKIVSEYSLVFGKNPVANAAPNFKTNEFYFQISRKMDFSFLADFRFEKPFLLTFGSKETKIEEKNSIVQLPVTEKTIEEHLVTKKSPTDITNIYNNLLRKKVEEENPYVCIYLHAIFEPFRFEKILENIAKTVHRLDMKPTTHKKFFQTYKRLDIINYSQLKERKS